MYQVMRLGWNRYQLEEFLATTRESYAGTPITLEIYRAPKVEMLFGTIEQPAADRELQQAFAGDGRTRVFDSDDTLRQLYPLTASAECLRCHVNAAEGDVLGVIDVREELGIISVAEFIEDEEIYRAVRECGVNLAQGYHVGRPDKALQPPQNLPPPG